jgi:hypothetical protein
MAANPLGPPITDPTVEVHRQIHPVHWKQEGRPSSQNFKPMPKDDGLLSLADGRLRTAEDAHRFAVEVQGLDSIGSWTLPVRAFNDHAVTVNEDSSAADPAHAVADYRGLTRGQERLLATALTQWQGSELRAASGVELPGRHLDATSETA